MRTLNFTLVQYVYRQLLILTGDIIHGNIRQGPGNIIQSPSNIRQSPGNSIHVSCNIRQGPVIIIHCAGNIGQSPGSIRQGLGTNRQGKKTRDSPGIIRHGPVNIS